MNTASSQTIRALPCITGVLSALLISACVTSGPTLETLGFLGDYAQLKPGGPGQASLIYIDGSTDFSGYTAVLVEPAVAWATPGTEPSEATRQLAKRFQNDLHRELAHEFDLVESPRAGSLRLRSALGSDIGSHVVLEVEVLDGVSGKRLVAAVDRRDLEASGTMSQTDAWAMRIRDRLASFRQFDANVRTRRAKEGGS